MIAKEELPRTYYSTDKNMYFMHYLDIQKNNMVNKFINNEYNSGDYTYSKDELKQLLEKNNYYKK
jgi:hypothetical protein